MSHNNNKKRKEKKNIWIAKTGQSFGSFMFSVQGGWNQFILSNSRFRSSLLHYEDLKAQLPVFVVRQEPLTVNVEGFVWFCFKSI